MTEFWSASGPHVLRDLCMRKCSHLVRLAQVAMKQFQTAPDPAGSMMICSEAVLELWISVHYPGMDL